MLACTQSKTDHIVAQGVNKRLAHFIGLSSLETSAVNIVVVCHTTPAATKDFGGWCAPLDRQC